MTPLALLLLHLFHICPCIMDDGLCNSRQYSGTGLLEIRNGHHVHKLRNAKIALASELSTVLHKMLPIYTMRAISSSESHSRMVMNIVGSSMSSISELLWLAQELSDIDWCFRGFAGVGNCAVYEYQCGGGAG